MTSQMISATSLYEQLQADGELAILDVRERGQYGLGHLLHAAHAPFSELEIVVPQLVPRRRTRMVLIDGNDGVGTRAAACLSRLGYEDISLLEGGTEAWREAGYETYLGEDVPSKAFGEIVATTFHTPDIEPQELKKLLDAQGNVVVLDGRTPEEHRRVCVPGSISVPNAELLYRLPDLVPDSDTTVVVCCAGRTRSIIGAQTLINAGVSNPVLALRGGTMGWRMADLELEQDSTSTFGAASREGSEEAAAYAAVLAEKAEIPRVEWASVEAERASGLRTVYLLDVRTAEEFAAGHLSGARHAPGGQLVQRVTRWCGTKGALLVLVDTSPQARAVTAAYWLRQMGWDACVLSGEVEAHFTERGVGRHGVTVPSDIGVERLDATALATALKAGAVALLDAGAGVDYRAGHLPGALWAIRPRLDRLSEFLESASSIVVYADSDQKALLLAGDVKRQSPAKSVAILSGGKAAWTAAGRTLDVSPDSPTDADCIDFLFWAHDRQAGNDAASREYFNWELGLPQQVADDGTANFTLAR